MPVKVNWYDEAQTIRHWQFIENWSWDEFSSLVAKHGSEPESKPYPVAILVDMTQNLALATHAFETFRFNELRAANNVSMYVVVGNRIIGDLVKVYRQLRRDVSPPVMAAQSVEEALKIIERHRASNDATDNI